MFQMNWIYTFDSHVWTNEFLPLLSPPFKHNNVCHERKLAFNLRQRMQMNNIGNVTCIPVVEFHHQL